MKVVYEYTRIRIIIIMVFGLLKFGADDDARRLGLVNNINCELNVMYYTGTPISDDATVW